MNANEPPFFKTWWSFLIRNMISAIIMKMFFFWGVYILYSLLEFLWIKMYILSFLSFWCMGPNFKQVKGTVWTIAGERNNSVCKQAFIQNKLLGFKHFFFYPYKIFNCRKKGILISVFFLLAITIVRKYMCVL